MPDELRPPPEITAAVDTILRTAWLMLRRDGWRRDDPRARTGAPGGLRVLDALTAAAECRPLDARRAALAAAAIAVEFVTGAPSHGLLDTDQADEYLSPATSDERLAQLDEIVLDRYNRHIATGPETVRDLLAMARTIAPSVIAVQLGEADEPGEAR